MKTFNEYIDNRIDESINDKNIFKAVFLAGGPGSGKSYIGEKMLGATIVSSDEIFEFLIKKENLPMQIDTTLGSAHMITRDRAKKMLKNKIYHLINGMFPILIDGTGKDVEKIRKNNEILKQCGYDTSIVIVRTTLEVALERNRKRTRSLPDQEVIKMWNVVDKNYEHFLKIFGQHNLTQVFNDEYFSENSKEEYDFVLKLFKTGQKFLTEPLKNPLGIKFKELCYEQKAKYLDELNLDNFNAKKIIQNFLS